MKVSIKRGQSQTGLSFAEREKVRPQFKRFLFIFAALLAMAQGARADIYTSVVDMKDLKVGDILASGFSLTAEKDDNWIYLDNGRYKNGNTVGEETVRFFLKTIESIDKDCAITSNGTKYTPVDVSGNDGNAWIVTNWAKDGNYYDIHISGYTLPTYTISYDANGGTGAPSAQTKTQGITLTLQAQGSLTRTGYTTDGWATSAGGAKAYNFGGSYTDNAAATLYSHWNANTYSVRFNKNASDATGTMSNEAFTYDTAKALTANAFSRAGYTFAGWNTQADGNGTSYTDGQSVSNLTDANGATVDLYAKWTAIPTYTAAFASGNDNSGWTISPTSGTEGTEVEVSYSGVHKVKSVVVKNKYAIAHSLGRIDSGRRRGH